jgi:hypothetical protein
MILSPSAQPVTFVWQLVEYVVAAAPPEAVPAFATHSSSLLHEGAE